ncbi:MAG: hypothetical protein WBW76_09960 [Candidatus Cybelea sp.]
MTTVPGTNLAVSYDEKFAGGNELHVAYGTPAATQTLDRFIVKYILHEEFRINEPIKGTVLVAFFPPRVRANLGAMLRETGYPTKQFAAVRV